MISFNFSKLSGLMLGAILGSSFASAEIVNPLFDASNGEFSGPLYSASISGSSVGGSSSAEGWFLYNNSNSVTSTELLTSTDPMGQGTMVHLTTGGLYNGLYQPFSQISNIGTSFALDVNVSSGIVYFAAYKNSGTATVGIVNSDPSKNGTWQTLELTFSEPTDELVIYSGSANGVDALVDNLRVVPEPGSLVALGIGLVGLARRRSRK